MGRTVLRPAIAETTALGAAFLAGLAVGVWKDKEEIRAPWVAKNRYEPQMEDAQRQTLLRKWKKAVSRARDWELDDEE